MLLETLLLSPCFLSAQSTHKDSKTILRIDKSKLEDDEVLLVFDIDDASEHKDCVLGGKGSPHRKKIRELLWKKGEEGHSLCDFLVFFAKGNERVFCFVDLKDNKDHADKATKQVISTYEAFKAKLGNDCNFNAKYKAYAFICSSSGNLPRNSSYLKDLQTNFEKYEHDGSSDSFLDFLQGKSKSFEKRGKRK
jgi:hypothetical protein